MRLVCWVGGNDIKAASGESNKVGAIASTIDAEDFTSLHLLYNYTEAEVTPYLAWLKAQTKAPVVARYEALKSPIDFHDIYIAADRLLTELAAASKEPIAVLISLGTPAMQAVWILLGKTRHQVTFYQLTVEQGVQQVDIRPYIEQGNLRLSHISMNIDEPEQPCMPFALANAEHSEPGCLWFGSGGFSSVNTSEYSDSVFTLKPCEFGLVVDKILSDAKENEYDAKYFSSRLRASTGKAIDQ